MKTIYNEKTIKYIFLLVPFFELYTFELIAAKGFFVQPLSIVMSLFSFCRLFISVVVIYRGLFRNFYSVSCTTWGILIFSLSRVVNSFLNGSFQTGLVIGGISYIGFALLCEEMMYESGDDFRNAFCILFGILTIGGIASIWLFPNGFFDAEAKAYAIYFLGSKNASFSYLFIYAYAWYIQSLLEKERVPRYAGILFLVFVATELVCDSSNAVLCFVILFGFHILIKYNKKIFELCTPLRLLIAATGACCLIVLGSTSSLLKKIVGMIGRDLSFSGRDLLWRQALDTIKNHPFSGEGVGKTYILATGVPMLHAHCFYLDVFAKYGVVPFLSILGMISMVMRKLSKQGRKKIFISAGAFVFTYLIHCITEDTSLYALSAILLLTESVCISEETVYRKTVTV